jgi:chromate reductase
MRIAIISGSARTNNNTIRVAKAVQRLMGDNHQVNIVDFMGYDIPLMAQGGLNPNSLTTFQSNLIYTLEDAHIVIIVSPEYNWTTTPELLNMLNYIGNKPFENLFNNKVFAFVGVSTGKGGKTPALHLMQIVSKLISFSNHQSVISTKIFESHFTKEVLDESGESSGNELYDKGLKDFCSYTEKIGNRWFK